MSRINVYLLLAFTSLIVIFFIVKLNNNDVQILSTISPKEFFESYKPEGIVSECLNNSKDGKNKSQEILIKAYNQKYIGCTFDQPGGLGYQLWRFASLYGLGRHTDRLPYFEGQNFEQMLNLKELGTIFPMMHEVLQIKNPPNIVVQTLDYGDESSGYINFANFFDFSEAKYLKIRGNYLQSYKYFQNYQNEIKNILKCGPTIMSSLKFVTENLLTNDTNFKLCAHIRRGKFLQDSMLESKEDFIYPVIDYAYQYFKDKSKISLILIGDDQKYMKNLQIRNNFYKIYIPKQQSRGEDMCLGMNYCDAMVMTASGSAFGWWISYLMKPNSTIFYNSQISDKGMSLKDVFDFDLFPEEWIKLKVMNGKVQKEEKWWRDRHG